MSVSGATRDDDVVVVIGDGLIGLSIAAELADRGVRATLVGDTRAGSASEAAAGLLIPSLGRLPPGAGEFFAASLAMYPEFVARARRFDPDLRLITGVVERSEAGDRLFPDDGAIDNVRLVAAMRLAVQSSPLVGWREGPALAIEATDSHDAVEAGGHAASGRPPSAAAIAVCFADGSRLTARHVVIAAGAWSNQLGGLPRWLPVRPLKGQMIAFGARVIERSMVGNDVYLVPRGVETLAGATVDEAGFDVTIDAGATQRLRNSAVALVPALESVTVTRAWTGLRPATPDLLPIIGTDSRLPGLLYACGHSKNGILLAPATAVAVSELVLGMTPSFDLRPFAVDRFRGAD